MRDVDNMHLIVCEHKGKGNVPSPPSRIGCDFLVTSHFVPIGVKVELCVGCAVVCGGVVCLFVGA